MGDNQPTKVTILRAFGSQGHFDVLHDGQWQRTAHVGGLTYDEMLGTIARLLCPVMENGSPNRQLGTPLHLEAPAKANAEM